MKYMDCNKREFHEMIKNKGLVCIGAGPMLQQAIRDLDISNNIEYLIDNNSNMLGTEIELLNRKITVNSINLLQRIDSSKIIILITTRFYESIRKQLESLFGEKDFQITVYLWIKQYLNRSKQHLDFIDARIVKPAVMFYEEYLQHCQLRENEISKLVEEKKKHIQDELQKGKIIVPKIGIRHKSSCTLQCKGCSMLIPKIENSYYIATEQVIKDLELFFESVDECISVGLSDGEPFLDPELDRLLEWLIANPKITTISLNTNGTVLPKKEWISHLQNEKVFVRISDYGYLSAMAKLIEVFENNQIRFSVLSNMEWFDAGDTACKKRTELELKYDYLRCMNSLTCKVLADGYFYLCERCFRMERLDIPGYDLENDKICLESYSKEERKHVIWDMYLRELAEACNFCDLGSREVQIIEAGIQLNEKGKKRSEYTIVKRT